MTTKSDDVTMITKLAKTYCICCHNKQQPMTNKCDDATMLLLNFIDIQSSDIYKICYMRHQIIITNTKYYLN